MHNQVRKVKAIPVRRLKMSRETERMGVSISFGNYRCRMVTGEDRALIGNLLHTCFHGEIDDEGWTAEQWRTMAKGTFRQGICPTSSLVLFDGSAPISAIVVVRRGRLGYLDLAMTDPKYRGQGLAGSLIRQSLHNLAGVGVDGAILWVTDGNKAAQKLYRKLGFVTAEESYHLKVVIS